MAKKNPSTRWFFRDWENDEALRVCSLAAQGLWMRLLCIMAENDGYLLLNGRHPTATELARYVGCSKYFAISLVRQLEQNGVFSRDEHQVIFNRRMVRENGSKAAEKADDSRAHVTRAHAHETRPHPQVHTQATLLSDSLLTPKSPWKGDLDEKLNDEEEKQPTRNNSRDLQTNPRTRGNNPRATNSPVYNHNGVTEHRPDSGPLIDPVELAIKLGIRSPDGKIIRT